MSDLFLVGIGLGVGLLAGRQLGILRGVKLAKDLYESTEKHVHHKRTVDVKVELILTDDGGDDGGGEPLWPTTETETETVETKMPQLENKSCFSTPEEQCWM